MQPRSAYVHIPFCRHRCGYCNFTLITGRDDLIAPLLTALERELETLQEPHPVDTIFFGGGTPTYLPLDALQQLLEITTRWLPPADGIEWSVEANPNDITAERMKLLAAYGVNRLSLGVQSFNATKLGVLERDHGQSDIERAVELARAEMQSVSLDLIFAAPRETLAIWEQDLEHAVQLKPDHLSCYGLTIEQGAAFYGRMLRGDIVPSDDDLQAEMYELAIDRLTAAGFEHYEVSNFAREGHRCRHNEAYWIGVPYLAFGPGAARYVNGRREMNHRSVTTYIRRMLSGESPVAETEQLEPEASARERLVFGLRRLEGIEPEAFRQSTGYSVDQLAGKTLRRYQDLGYMVLEPERIRLSRQGLLISDGLWPAILDSAGN